MKGYVAYLWKLLRKSYDMRRRLICCLIFNKSLNHPGKDESGIESLDEGEEVADKLEKIDMKDCDKTNLDED